MFPKDKYILPSQSSGSNNEIASGGDNMIYTWNSNTGQLLVGPIEDLGEQVTSVVWSSDSLYSASDRFV
jgi:hypothetical protein